MESKIGPIWLVSDENRTIGVRIEDNLIRVIKMSCEKVTDPGSAQVRVVYKSKSCSRRTHLYKPVSYCARTGLWVLGNCFMWVRLCTLHVDSWPEFKLTRHWTVVKHGYKCDQEAPPVVLTKVLAISEDFWPCWPFVIDLC